jgi:hypothetical protein
MRESIEKSINRAVQYSRRSASQSNPGRFYNSERYVKYCKGIEQDFIQAAKDNCLSAKLNKP